MVTDFELELSPLDQDVHLSTTDADEIYALVDGKINQAIEKRDIRIIVSEIATLRQGAKIVGLSLVRVLGRIAENWSLFNINEPMKDFLYATTGLNHATIDRYIKVHTMLQMAPPEAREKLQSVNVKNLIPIGNMIGQGWELEEQDWKRIADVAEDYNDVAEITRELKGAEPRKSGLRLWMDRSGTISAFKDGNREYVGTLDIANSNPVVQQAIERILKNGGILSQ